MIYQSEVKRTQALKLFHLIQQVSDNPRNILTSKALEQFSIKFYGNQISGLQILHQIDTQGREMESLCFAQSVSTYFTDKMDSVQDLISFNCNIVAMIFRGNQVYKEADHQLITQMTSFKVMDIDVEQRTKLITSFLDQLNFQHFYSTAYLLDSLKKLNFCLQSFYEKCITQNVTPYYLNFIKNNLIERCFELLGSSDQINVECLQTLAFMVLAMKHKAIRQEMRTLMSQKNYWQILLRVLQKVEMYNYTDERKWVLCIWSQLALQIPEFLDYLIQKQEKTIFQTKNNSNPLQCIYQCKIISQILKRYESYTWQVQKYLQGWLLKQSYQVMVFVLQKYSMHDQVYAYALRLLRFLIAIKKLENNLTFDTKILEETKNKEVISESLMIFQIGIKLLSKKFVQIFCGSQKIMEFVRGQLCKYVDLTNSQSTKNNLTSCMFQCQCLQIAYALASPQNKNYFFKCNLLQTLAVMTDYETHIFSTMISRIVLRLSKSSNEELCLTYLKQKLPTIILKLLPKVFQSDIFMNSYLAGNTYLYFNTEIFLNIFKSLNLLLIKQKENSILFMEKEEISYFMSIKVFQTVESFFNFDKKQIIHLVLQQKQELWGRNVKMFRVIFQVLEELTVSMGYRENEDRRQLFAKWRLFLAKLYGFVKSNELQAQSIPIYIQYSIHYNFNFNFSIQRLMPSKYDYQSVYDYIKTISFEQLKKNRPQLQQSEQDFDIKIIDEIDKKEIHNQFDYKRMISKITKQYERSQFKAVIKIDFMEKSRSPSRRNMHDRSYHMGKSSQKYRQTHRSKSPINSFNTSARFQNGGSRMTTSRYRTQLPVFAQISQTYCMICKQKTLNAKICNRCNTTN